MAIKITKYVDITSALGGASQIDNRTLVARIFTDYAKLPPNKFISFTDAASVGAYFGTSSEEYLRSVFYFSFISKSLSTPQSIQFARWANVATAPKIYSIANNTQDLAAWQAISSGTFTLTIAGTSHNLNIDFQPANNLNDVASFLQTAIQAADVDPVWASATVTYNPTTLSYDFVGGVTGDYTISVSPELSGTDISGINFLGWYPGATYVNGAYTSGAFWVDGSAAQSIDQALQASVDYDNNFGSFLFLNSLNLSLNDVIAAASWNQTQGVNYMYLQKVSSANATAWANVSTGVGSYGGCGLTISDIATQYPEQFPAMILAATDYTQANSVQNYMYQQVSGLTPSVSTTTASNTFDAASVNYYGQTQTNGSQLSFYQRGLLQGASVATNIPDMTSYANEMWLKDAMQTALINLLLALPQIAANIQGKTQILAVMQNVINLALNNGCISVGKSLTQIQKTYIGQITANPDAWYEVQNNGYYYDVVIEPIPNVSPVQYQANYLLVYSKDDVIRKIVGTNILI